MREVNEIEYMSNHLLEKVNSDNVMSNCNNVYRLDKHFSELYTKFFSKDNRNLYSNNWLYIKQASRNKNLGYYDGERIFAMGMHKDHIVVVRPIGKLDYNFIDILSKLRKITKLPVFVKKIEKQDLGILCKFENIKLIDTAIKKIDSNCSKSNLVWDEVAVADDDTYPEIIVSIDLLLDVSHSPAYWFEKYHTLFYKDQSKHNISKIKRNYKAYRWAILKSKKLSPKVNIIPYELSNKKLVFNFISEYFDDNQKNIEPYHYLISRPHNPSKGIFTYLAILEETKEIIGYICAGRIGEQGAGIYAEISSKLFSGFSEYLSFLFYSCLKSYGITELNLGGSETIGLHHFKKKFGSIQEIHMKMIVYE